MVDDAAIEAFARDGVVIVRGILSPSEIELLATGVEWALAHPSERTIVALRHAYTLQPRNPRIANRLRGYGVVPGPTIEVQPEHAAE